MKDEAIYRNDYPLLSRSKPLTPKAATMEALIISKINPVLEGDLSSFKIEKSLLARYGICDVKNMNYVRDLEAVAEELLGYMIGLPPIDGYKARWRPLVSRFDVEDSDLVSISVDAHLAPYLIDLRKHFTKVDVIEVAMLSSQYSKKLYMLIKSFEYKEQDRITLDILKSALGISDIKYYQDFKNLNRKILLPAQKEINNKSDICVNWESIRYGRRIGALEIKVKKNSKHQPKLPLVEEITDNIPTEIRVYLDSYGYSNDDYISQLIKSYGADVILISIQIFDRRMKSTSIKNKAGLFHTRIISYISQAKLELKKSVAFRKKGIEKTKILQLQKNEESRKLAEWQDFKILNESEYAMLLDLVKGDDSFNMIHDNINAVDAIAFSLWLEK